MPSSASYSAIQLYRSSTGALAPVAGTLTAGELFINYADTDMAVYAKNASLAVKRIMNNPAGLKYPTADGTANQVIKTDGSGALAFVNTTIPPATNSADYAPQWDGANSHTLKNGYPVSATAGAATIPVSDGSNHLDTWVSDSSETVKGKVELATVAEVLAGTDTARAVTCAGVKASTDVSCPTGAMMMWPKSTPPTGWLVRDGSAISRTTYSVLFALLGTAFGVGDNSTTFNLPDDRELVSVGYKAGSTEFGTFGGTFGAKTHTLNISQMPSHTHPPASGSQFVVFDAPAWSFAGGIVGGPGGATGATGGGLAHNNIQPSRVYLPIIKY